jgi:expansin
LISATGPFFGGAFMSHVAAGEIFKLFRKSERSERSLRMIRSTSEKTLSAGVFIALAFFIPGPFADVDDGSVLHKGEATFYSDTTFGHCGFPTAQQQYYHGAMNNEDYDTAASCGTWVHITGPLGEVTAFIDDECPECKKGDIDLGPRTFGMIGNLADGRIPISWRYVEAPVSGPIRYFWKDGSSQWHIELQIRNHRYAIYRVEICIPPGDWISMPRQTYNFFVLAGGVNAKPGPYTIRVTDIFGQQLVDSNVALIAEQVVDGKTNFPERLSGAAGNRPLSSGSRFAQSKYYRVLMIGGISAQYYHSRGTFELFALSGKSMGIFDASELTSKRLKGLIKSTGVVVIHRLQNR